MSAVMDGCGRSCGTQVETDGAFVYYYRDLLKSEGAHNVESCIYAVKKKISPNMATGLLAKFTKEEVQAALQDMPPNKALGPDGYTTDFYQLQ
jgi:hypothetical protein